MAMITGTPLDEVTNWYRTTFKMRGNWTGSTKHRNLTQFFALKGVWTVHTPYGKDRVRTVADFVEWHTKPNTWYMLRSAGHIMVARNGWLGDQSEIKPAGEHWCKNKRVKDVWEIL